MIVIYGTHTLKLARQGPVSIKHGLRTRDCGLGIKCGVGIERGLRTTLVKTVLIVLGKEK